MEIKLSPKYESLFKWLTENETRIDTVIITGGRYSAKSFGVGLFSCVGAKDYNHNILYTRYTLVSAQDSIIPEFSEKISLLGADQSFNVTKDRIECVANNSKIVFKGIKTSSGNQTASLKSLKNFSMFILEEAEEMPNFDDWDKITKSIRSIEVNNLSILILNPTTKVHWIYREFFEGKGVSEGFNGVIDNVMYIHTTYLDVDRKYIPTNIFNDFEDKRIAYELWDELPKDQQENSHLKKKALYYKHVILGGWLEKSEGVIFTNWSIGEFVDTGYTMFGSDWGFSSDPTTLVRVSVDSSTKIIYLKQECYKTRMSTDDISTMMGRICGDVQIIADSAEPRLIDELKGRGHNIKGALKGAGSIKEGIAVMLDYNIIVTPCSVDLIKELNNYAWSDKKSETPIDKYNHAIDAVRYACSQLLVPKRYIAFGDDD